MKRGLIIIVLLGLVLLPQTALASKLFYTGNIGVDSIDIKVEIQEKAELEANFFLKNYGEDKEEVSLSFAQCSAPLFSDGEELKNPISFEPGESKSIRLSCELDVTGETTKSLSIDPTLLFNGKPNAKPTKTLSIKALLPEGISKLVSASEEPSKEGFEDNRKFYEWHESDIYPTPLTLIWSTLQVDLDVYKEAIPREITEPGQVVRIEITVKNNGDAPVDNIILSDQYVALDFEAVDPIEEFSERENILTWSREIDSLDPGESRTLSYSVKYIGSSPRSHDFYLKPCVLTIDGKLISVSNKVRMSLGEIPPQTIAEAQAEKETEKVHYPSIFEISGIILVVTGGVGYLIRRRRRGGGK